MAEAAISDHISELTDQKAQVAISLNDQPIFQWFYRLVVRSISLWNSINYLTDKILK